MDYGVYCIVVVVLHAVVTCCCWPCTVCGATGGCGASGAVAQACNAEVGTKNDCQVKKQLPRSLVDELFS